MSATRKSFVDQHSHGIDLLIGNRSSYALGSDQAQHTVSPKHPLPLLVARHQLDEQITAEQWQFYRFLAVVPPMHLGKRRQEGCHAPFPEAVSHGSLVPRPGMHCVPVLTILPDHYWWAWRLPCLVVGFQSFAPLHPSGSLVFAPNAIWGRFPVWKSGGSRRQTWDGYCCSVSVARSLSSMQNSTIPVMHT